jgi:hypothetical protein
MGNLPQFFKVRGLSIQRMESMKKVKLFLLFSCTAGALKFAPRIAESAQTGENAQIKKPLEMGFQGLSKLN